jgi:alkanesulfonate monooxygenase SsuD/methylene tetrahydromethanopterin reductase-like flavin-dependent oxidoreductase (luciferase family)
VERPVREFGSNDWRQPRWLPPGEARVLQFGLATHGMVAGTDRPLFDQVESTAELVRFAASLGTLDAVRAQHHWLSYPTIWIEPMLLLARLAPEAGNMRLMTSVLKPPLHNPVELAHQVATLDHICNGRFILGVGVGYDTSELEAVGATRRQRASRIEESLTLMKMLWSGDEVTFEGRYTSVHNVRMGYRPLQQPHPPIWNASYSIAATRRAARLCDGILIAPQTSWETVAMHAGEYRQALAECGKSSGMVGVNRVLSVARDYETADRLARARMQEAAESYSRWGMNEATTVDMILDADRDPRDWAIVGTPDDCVEALVQHAKEIGIGFIGLGTATWPKDLTEQQEYLQFISEEVLGRVRART